MLIVKGIKCLKCGCIIFSRALADERRCSCRLYSIRNAGTNSISASFYGAGVDPGFEFVDIKLNCTKKELVNDFKNGNDKYGFIKPNEQQNYKLTYEGREGEKSIKRSNGRHRTHSEVVEENEQGRPGESEEKWAEDINGDSGRSNEKIEGGKSNKGSSSERITKSKGPGTRKKSAKKRRGISKKTTRKNRKKQSDS